MAFLVLPDLDKRNLLNVVKENFERVGLTTYGIRMIYAGEHALTKDQITTQFRKSVTFVNQGYTDIPVNGILLVYDSYFVHILEGSEDTLYRQLRFLFNIEEHFIEKMTRLDEEEEAAAAAAAAAAEEEARAKGPAGAPAARDEEEAPREPRPPRIVFRKLKMLMVYHSITKFLFDSWRAIHARPLSLVGKLDVYAPIEEHMEQLRICLDKIAKLCRLSQEEPELLSFEGLSTTDPKIETLPEVALLDYLLTSPHIMDLREVASYHRRVDDYIFYYEQVWPLPTSYTPRYLYKLKIDDSFVEPLPVMPWEMKIDENEEEDPFNQQTGGSSSSD